MLTCQIVHVRPHGHPGAGLSVTRTRQSAHLKQSAGVVTVTLQRQPPAGVAEQVEPFACENSVALHVPSTNPGSQAAWPKKYVCEVPPQSAPLCAIVSTSGLTPDGHATQRPEGAQVVPLLQVLPLQQSSPRLPQLTSEQVPPVQLSPAAHEGPLAQQTSPLPPQGAAVHTPLLQVNPALHGVPPAQHGCPVPPHIAPPGQPAGGVVLDVSVMVRRHVAHLLQSAGVVTRSLHRHPPSGVAEHVEPLACDTSVAVHAPSWNPASQDAGPKSKSRAVPPQSEPLVAVVSTRVRGPGGHAAQLPATHALPATQVLPPQHGWPAAPHAVVAVHVPPVHVSPAPHGVLLRQQDWPGAPHGLASTKIPIPPGARSPGGAVADAHAVNGCPPPQAMPL
jgi:hypothetical protein